MAEHTPGPWERLRRSGQDNSGSIAVGQKDSPHVCSVRYSQHPEFPLEVAEANARLIAAAPELLEAAKSALWFDANNVSDSHLDVDIKAKLEAAIAKAKGV